jgi:hypothetical protein
MTPDWSISGWTRRIAGLQWPREDQALDALGEALPDVLVRSRPLAEVHRLDLALFVVFEEAALRVSGALTRRAPDSNALAFAAQQTLDEARHHELFSRRFELARTASGLTAGDARDAILIPPLRRFLEHCYEVADGGSFVEGMTLMNLVLEGMAYPLYGYEERYWASVDPFLSRLVRFAFVDETRHCAFGAALVRQLLDDDPARRARVTRLCDQARTAMAEVFDYYVRKFVGAFDAVARRHAGLFADAELAPGKLISQTPYQEQIQMIHHRIETEHARLLQRAGLQ